MLKYYFETQDYSTNTDQEMGGIFVVNSLWSVSFSTIKEGFQSFLLLAFLQTQNCVELPDIV